MASVILHLFSHVSNNAPFIAGIVAAGVFIAKVVQRSDLDAIPTVGSDGWLGSWWDGFKFFENGFNVLREGYAKHKGRPFKIADRYRWLVIFNSREHREELGKATEDQFSFNEVIRTRMSGDYTLGTETMDNPYHVPIVRSQFSGNNGIPCSEIKDEIVTAFGDILDLKRDGWKSVRVLDTMQKVVFRTSHKFFVGLPLCRNPDWMNFCVQSAVNVNNGVVFLQHFPLFLQSLASLFIPNVTKATEYGIKFIGPIIAERQRNLDKYGDKWADKPNDLLSWLMDVAEGKERTVQHLTRRVMFLNFVSVHSVSQNFAHALIFLATNPQYMEPLREEVEVVIEQEGWSKTALDRMRKVDSLLKETQRLKGTTLDALSRVAMVDYTFSDGTFIPKGTVVGVPAGCLHLDSEFYEDPRAFNPFRFAKLREEEGEGAKHQYVSTTLEYLPFGHGKHACPGRFFAASMMKAMLAHIVLSYDVKLEDGYTIPKDLHIGTSISVNPEARVMFRKRAGVEHA